ncbi:MAG: hypothetical protein OHK0011_12850 [Turneriella sp.]
MKLLLHVLLVVGFALPLNLAFAESKAEQRGKKTECCEQKDCCQDCKHKDGKHSCCDDKLKAKECCKNCKDKKCEKACADGKCKKDHCDKKKGKSADESDAT